MYLLSVIISPANPGNRMYGPDGRPVHLTYILRAAVLFVCREP